MGLNSEIEVGLATLGTGVTTDRLQCSGTMPLRNDELKINATMSASSYEHLKKKQLGIASNPKAVTVGLRRCK